MTMKFTWKPRSSDIPTKPGVYRFSDSNGQILYVGKAKHLRNRINSYFASREQHPRTSEMLSQASAVDWLIVNSEVESLQLEHTWINEFKPPFNVRFRDDKSYPWICFTMKEEFPRIIVVRGKRRKDNLYFGPYPNAREARDLSENLLRVFPVRSCSDQQFNRAQKTQRACMLADIGKCSAPCISKVSAEEHRDIVNQFTAAIKGNFRQKQRDLQQRMKEASDAHEFERAALYRDQVNQLESIYQPTSVVLNETDSFDVFAIYSDDLEISIQVLNVRQGLLISQKHFLLDKVEEIEAEDVLQRVLPQYYLETPLEINEILVNLELTEGNGLSALLDRGTKQLAIHKPIRGRKREILELALTNAKSALEVNHNVRSHDVAKRSLALNELTQALDLPQVPMRIECVDISHLAGTNTVGSLVVFVDGLPKKSDYRFYNLGDINDDLSAIQEVVSRRAKRLLNGDVGWSESPDLLLIDGGVNQASIAWEVLRSFNLDIPVFSLAKRFESVHNATTKSEMVIPRSSEALFLLQRIRDEAHRFALTQQQKSRKRNLKSQLEDIPGLGPRKISSLFSHFGSVRNIKSASVEEIASVPGINDELAGRIWKALNSVSSVALNATTGEVIEGA